MSNTMRKIVFVGTTNDEKNNEIKFATASQLECTENVLNYLYEKTVNLETVTVTAYLNNKTVSSEIFSSVVDLEIEVVKQLGYFFTRVRQEVKELKEDK